MSEQDSSPSEFGFERILEELAADTCKLLNQPTYDSLVAFILGVSTGAQFNNGANPLVAFSEGVNLKMGHHCSTH
ncbi:MAG: hypothetical protein CMJ78_05720 [Planctomycetaceae bacterium]|nr:hypothetical protein [Planctomycetaceae bacterium]